MAPSGAHLGRIALRRVPVPVPPDPFEVMALLARKLAEAQAAAEGPGPRA